MGVSEKAPKKLIFFFYFISLIWSFVYLESILSFKPIVMQK